eukprot:TRINITY_DN6489_c0_g5_i1.p1 TRINITY_DN6489_c0_g5~~TRINITY_DN6489_c0_g5_i1.p1  ORF type:complete len:117 (-),score=39.25 TRINITY_DN6489_c0_g5_i1:63-413(-)
MLPKTKLKKQMLNHLFIFKKNYHNFDLPQFSPQVAIDPNKYMGYGAITPDAKIVFHSEPEVPAELRHLKVELDPDITTPDNYFEAVRGRGKKHVFASVNLEKWSKLYKRYKTTRKF